MSARRQKDARRASSLVAVGALIAAFVVVVGPTAPASASGLGTSYSAAAYGTAGNLNVSPVVTSPGLVSSSLVTLLTPLTAAINSLASGLASDVVTGLTSAGLVATTPQSSQSAPSSGFPASCTSGGWNTRDCYNGVNITALGVPGVLTLGLSAAQGYAAADSTGYTAAARSAGASVTLLGANVGSLGVSTSSATCNTTGTCSSNVTMTGLSLFNGAVTASEASGTNLLMVSLNGASAVPLSSLSTTLTPVGSTGVSVRADGKFLQITVSVNLTSLLDSLGLGGLLTSLLGLTVNTSVQLSLVVGPGYSSSSGASAWGLDLGVDLAGTISVTDTGLLAGVTGSVAITIPSGITTSPTGLGNVASLELAYSAATAGSAVTNGPVWYPPGFI